MLLFGRACVRTRVENRLMPGLRVGGCRVHGPVWLEKVPRVFFDDEDQICVYIRTQTGMPRIAPLRIDSE